MRKSLLVSAGVMCLLLVVALTLLGVWQQRVNSNALAKATHSVSALASPADKAIQAAEKLLQRQPQLARGHNQLSAALIQKARETGDAAFTDRAAEAVRRSLEITPDPQENYDALRLQATLQLSEHRFADALKLGQQMQKLRPQDHFVYGVLTDASVELGDYAAAVKAADQMIELRPDATSYARISYLRSLYGHTEPALEAMRLAVRSANPRVPEGQAWYRVQLGNELLNVGRRDEAEREFDAALQVFHDYYEALEAKARVRVAAQDYPSAVEYYRRALTRARQPEAYIGLSDLYEKLGRPDEAERQRLFLESTEHRNSSSHSRQYVIFLANHNLKLDEALAMAQRERAARSDIYTCDALAWVLFKHGRLAEAKTKMGEAMRLGTRDARLYYHAGMIYHALGEREPAKKYLEQALQLNPVFDLSQTDTARQTLAALR
jgi:tetratricopeptide (TPR) repeat protein